MYFNKNSYICNMNVIARYNNMVFSCRKLGTLSSWQVNFIDFYEGPDTMFIGKYKPRFPEYSFQIYKHESKSMFTGIRDKIIESIKEPSIRDKLREYNLSKLL